MAGWHHRLNGHELEQTPGVGDGQVGLACCDSWGHKESDTKERVSNYCAENWHLWKSPGRVLQSNWSWQVISKTTIICYLVHWRCLIPAFGR